MGTSTQTPAHYQAVTVGASRWIHARSLFRMDETACGLQQNGTFAFTRTTELITCPYCERAITPRPVA